MLLAHHGADVDVAADKDYGAQASFRQKDEQLIITKTMVGDNRHTAILQHHLNQAHQTVVLKAVATKHILLFLNG